MPVVLVVLSFVGTIAMLWVGGGIMLHGMHELGLHALSDWAHDAFGEPIREPRLQFMTDLMCVNAREHVAYEVAPQARSREDPNVYRADVVGIRHPDAEFIATFDPATVTSLLDRIAELEAQITAN